MMHCPTCEQNISHLPRAEYKGLSVSKATGICMFEGNSDLTSLTPMRVKLLRKLIEGGPEGKHMDQLIVLLNSQRRYNLLAVHMSAIREWFDENVLPFRITCIMKWYFLVRCDDEDLNPETDFNEYGFRVRPVKRHR